ncbi:MAG: exodeoxyribonuclease VII large subunit [Anaerolineales bacterium]|nr:exodeoxyribonuclease VII large subunit [Anaerolineales bacterium]
MFLQPNLLDYAGVSAPYTVSQLNAFIRRLLESEPQLQDVRVEGEVSNFSRATSGHCYFTLKDSASEIGCVMWRSDAARQGYLPENGDQVQARGRVAVYEARGRYQLVVVQLEPAGIGGLYLEYERLRRRLADEGLFAPERKRPLPPFPRRIGIVTSPAAAALRDIINVLGRRYPLAELLLAPTAVQGSEAPPQILAALEALNSRSDVDVIIVARGGGSLEELWAFNDERVARAIASSRIPIVVGVGHETDFTLADFAADVRAPTPSAAAELVAPDQAELRAQVMTLWTAQIIALAGTLDAARWRVAEEERLLARLSPADQVRQTRERVGDLLARAGAALSHTVRLRHERLRGLIGRLDSVSPVATLERGYALVRHRQTGVLIRSVAQVEPGLGISVRVADGEFDAEAT